MISKTIKSYLYWQYADDEDLQAFITAYNTMTQDYVDWFYNISLPIYTQLNGDLLDWVGLGLYGIHRSSIGVFINRLQGTLNSYEMNTTEMNGFSSIVNYTLTDDQYKKVITWHFYKADGKQFSIGWLKRRIERFLYGINGGDSTHPTYKISVQFIDSNTVLINSPNQIFTLLNGSGTMNSFQMNSIAAEMNSGIFYNIQTLPTVDLSFLKVAIDSKILELPFQFNYVVSTT